MVLNGHRLGDSVNFLRNSIVGANIGIEVPSWVQGAAKVHIDSNTIENTGGCIKFGDYQQDGTITNNFFELSNGSTGSNGSAVDIDGGTHIGSNLLIQGNTFNTGANASPTLNNLRINLANGTTVRGNAFSRNAGASQSVLITASATNTFIDFESWNGDVFPQTYSDLGAATLVAGTLEGSATPRLCVNATVSGTAQVCNTNQLSTLRAGDEIIYLTNTTNTGALAVTLNGISLPVKKWGGSAACDGFRRYGSLPGTDFSQR